MKRNVTAAPKRATCEADGSLESRSRGRAASLFPGLARRHECPGRGTAGTKLVSNAFTQPTHDPARPRAPGPGARAPGPAAPPRGPSAPAAAGTSRLQPL